MSQSLNEMSNEELGQLFPIIIKEHNPEWILKFEAEKELLTESIGIENIERISHIGSTAVPDLLAKPTIDIIIEIKEDTDLTKLIQSIKNAGYGYTPQPNNPAPHMMFMKGYSPEGFKGQAFHVHVRYSGNWDELVFRDYLLTHPDTVKEYGQLKLNLKDKYEHDRDGYTAAKTDFIHNIVNIAKGKPYRIKTTSDKWYNDFYGIYAVSFPIFEQRNKEQQEYAFKQKNYYLDCTIRDNKFLSFIAYWDFDEYIYIEHLAVNPDYRGENIGSTVLMDFINSKKKMILLEIDPLTTDIAKKRFRFYEKLGFVDNPYPHFHPPYDKKYPPHELIVLSLNIPIDEQLYQTFYKDLSEKVMVSY